jgi:hypothetical protein
VLAHLARDRLDRASGLQPVRHQSLSMRANTSSGVGRKSGWSSAGALAARAVANQPDRPAPGSPTSLRRLVDAILELVVAPALVGAATLAARRWGQRIGGLVSAFPAIVGPVLLVAALEHGAAFAARAANGTLLGLVALAGFALAYGRAAPRCGWRASLGAGWTAAAALGVAVGAVAAGPPLGLLAAAVSLATAHRLLGGATAPGEALPAEPVVPRWDLPLRMALTALLAVSLTAAASRLGPLVGGVLAALPVLASILAVFTHARYGPAAVVDLLRGMLGGMAGFVCFCALVAALVSPAGIAAAFALSAVAALAVQGATARAGTAPQPAPVGA